ncbi:MAG: lipase [Flavobacteriaceae bacterium]|nr:lipase [Flavobacteriaceae bacterium]|tara:strand:- start:3182 stop:4282 length:1101 start_codon:yes stop_codon:yes gene_type:complete
MKQIYSVALLFLFLYVAPNTLLAQCGDVTLESLTDPGPFNVDTLTEADGIRNGPDYAGATIYYPTDATPPYAGIAIVPGFTAAPSSVEDWGPFYASHGIVTIIIGTNSPFDFPEARAAALLDALETLRQENTRETSPLEDKIDAEKFAVSGWSMGGGGAQRAAVLNNTIKGVVALCPWLPDPSLNHNSPVVIFSGQNDTTAPPAQHANPHYNATPSTTEKLLFEIENGNHSVANSPTGGNGVIGKIALSWLKLYVEDNDCYCPLLTESLLDNPPAASNVQTNIECAPILGIDDLTSSRIKVFPNPTHDLLTVMVDTNVSFEIYSPLGQQVLKGRLHPNNNQINIANLANGLYYLHLEGQTIKIIKN